jgi:hypothetical protein
MLGAGGHKLPSHRGRIIGENRFLLIIALPQTDAFAAAEIDGRPDLHGPQFRRFFVSRGGVFPGAETRNIAYGEAIHKSPGMLAVGARLLVVES